MSCGVWLTYSELTCYDWIVDNEVLQYIWHLLSYCHVDAVIMFLCKQTSSAV